MARKNESPQKAAMREMMRSYLKDNAIRIKNGTDVNAIMRDMMSVILEDVLDEELDEELGYSKYDYRNKDTDNSRNGHSKKTMHTSYGDMDVADVSHYFFKPLFYHGFSRLPPHVTTLSPPYCEKATLSLNYKKIITFSPA